MNKASSVAAILSVVAAIASTPCALASTQARFRHIAAEVKKPAEENITLLPEVDSTLFIVREVDEIINSLEEPDFKPTPINKTLGPWIFSGYRKLQKKDFDNTIPTFFDGLSVLTNDSAAIATDKMIRDVEIAAGSDSIPLSETEFMEEIIDRHTDKDIDILADEVTPRWLRNALTSYRIQEDFMYGTMVSQPSSIDYSYWDLPERPKLPEDDISFAAYIRKLDLPEVDPEKAELPEQMKKKIHWLHNFNAAMQFSQAYVSENWYQGGNNHLALLFNVLWNVQLNQVYHPNLLFQSTLSYKLGLNSTPQDEYHKYSISEDVLQYNLNTGLKAFDKWFYSFNLQAKTQILRNYEKNSMKRKASFLSPGDLNIGLGMAYSHQSKNKNFQITATISPISYNLKTCIDDQIDHAQFNIAQDKKTHSEIGSNGEVNMNWNIYWNINYRSRLFLFSDYKYFLSDWEHTLSFNINKFLSTQIYVHMRYDTSADNNTSWKHFMLREVLSFGLSYTFSTKP